MKKSSLVYILPPPHVAFQARGPLSDFKKEKRQTHTHTQYFTSFFFLFFFTCAVFLECQPGQGLSHAGRQVNKRMMKTKETRWTDR